MRIIPAERRAWNARLLLALILLLSGCGSTGSSSDEETITEEGRTTISETTSTEETLEATTEISESTTAPKQDDANTWDTSDVVTVAGVLEKPDLTIYMYGTHAITDEASGTSYALRSEDEGLLDDYVGQRVSVHGMVVPGYENGQIEGGPPLLDVIWVGPAE